jgi:nucleoside-diphosphate kinase
MEQTLTIIKPDSMAAGNAGKIFAHLEQEGFKILALRRIHLSQSQARAFYEVHKERPFYNDLVAYMTEAPVIAVALERDDAVTHLRQVMGATNPEEAAEGRGPSEPFTALPSSAMPSTAAIRRRTRP